MRMLAVPANRLIRLPKSVFKPADKIVVVTDGSMVVIKKVESPRLSSIAARAHDRPMPMSTIVREVHAHRRARRA